MSGIVGIYYPSGQPVGLDKLEKMLDILVHRGADGVNFYCKSNVGLGHRMLWTTPESLSEQLPLTNQAGDLTITADARIDNRDELIAALSLQKLTSEKISDSEIILAAYEKWRENCADKLLGAFAFVIWDRQQQQLFCARDHFGVKPFYYYHGDRRFIFASEIKAIVGLPEVPKEINEVRIGDYLTSTLDDAEITSYQNVWRLLPAHTLTVSCQGELSLNRYWSLDPSRTIELNSDREYAEKFRAIFTEAVRCRLRSAFPVGSHLSGGLDSTSVTCVARDLLQQDNTELHTFSNIFDSVPECNEREYIETVIKEGGLTPHFVHPDQTGPLSQWQQFFKYSDESLIGNCYLIWGLNRATEKAGVRIALNGFDGDTTVSHGVLRLTELANSGDWETFISEGTALAQNFKQKPQLILRHYGTEVLKQSIKRGKLFAFMKGISKIYIHIGLSRHQLLIECGVKPLLPKALQQTWRKLRHGVCATTNPFPLINPEFAQRINLQKRLRKFDSSDNPPLTVKEHNWRELTSGLMSIPLESMDIFAAAFGIEYRHPFMDKRLIEYCLALPASQKMNQGWSRIVLRRAMAGILPPEIQWRGDKSNLTPSFNQGLFKYNKSLLEVSMVKDAEKIANFINLKQLNNIYQNLISKNKLKKNTVNNIWSVVSLFFWLESLKK